MVRLPKWRPISPQNLVRQTVVTFFRWFSIAIFVSSCFLSISSAPLSSWPSTHAPDKYSDSFAFWRLAVHATGQLGGGNTAGLSRRSQDDEHQARMCGSKLESSVLPPGTKSINSAQSDDGSGLGDCDLVNHSQSSRDFQPDEALSGALTDAELGEYVAQVSDSRIGVRISQSLCHRKCSQSLNTNKLLTRSISEDFGFSSRFAWNLRENLLASFIPQSQFKGEALVLGLSEKQKCMCVSIPQASFPLELSHLLPMDNLISRDELDVASDQSGSESKSSGSLDQSEESTGSKFVRQPVVPRKPRLDDLSNPDMSMESDGESAFNPRPYSRKTASDDQIYERHLRSSYRPAKINPHLIKSAVSLFVLPMAGVMFLLAVGISLWWTSHRRYRGRGRAEVILCPEMKIFPTRHFRLTADDIRQATGSATGAFDTTSCCRIGEGRLTRVYQVILGDGRSCAVKILTNQKFYNRSIARRELQTLGSLRHKNIAKLLGYFFDGHTKALVLEFMPNGSLDKHLRNGGLNDISFQQRLDIALDVAEALTYLHHDCIPGIVHGNLTPRNIFLDYDLKARVGDVGLGRLIERLSSTDSTLASPKCCLREPYIAPEIQQQGKLAGWQWNMGLCADVYSFGSILLELLTTGRNLNSSFAGHVDGGSRCMEAAWSRSQQPEVLLDHALLNYASGSEVQKTVIAGCVELALSCMNSVPEDRPNMKDVCAMLFVYRQLDESNLTSKSLLTAC